MTARVARIVLETRCLRYSSPLEFNDPFDVTQKLRLNFDAQVLSDALVDRVAWLLEHADADPPIKHPFFRAAIRWAASLSRDDRRKFAAEFRQSREGATPGQAQNYLDLLKAMWSELVPRFRILCLSEVNDAAPMWNHYADKYRGVVLEFFAVKEVDGIFQVARPVLYQDAPSLAEAKGWVNCMLREGDARYEELFMEYLYVKTPDWSYEKEWRIPVCRGAARATTSVSGTTGTTRAS